MTKEIQKQLTEMVYDINPTEISSHIENDSLRDWCRAWGNKMLEIISSIPYAKDDNYEKGYQNGLNADKWISVKDRLPEKEVKVLVTREYKKERYVDIAERCGWEDDNPEWMSFSDEYKTDPQKHKVIAWQPLPESAKM